MDTYIFTKEKKAFSFVCGYCKKEKKSKNTARCGIKILCNGCYGYLLSKNLIVKKDD